MASLNCNRWFFCSNFRFSCKQRASAAFVKIRSTSDY